MYIKSLFITARSPFVCCENRDPRVIIPCHSILRSCDPYNIFHGNITAVSSPVKNNNKKPPKRSKHYIVLPYTRNIRLNDTSHAADGIPSTWIKIGNGNYYYRTDPANARFKKTKIKKRTPCTDMQMKRDMTAAAIDYKKKTSRNNVIPGHYYCTSKNPLDGT